MIDINKEAKEYDAKTEYSKYAIEYAFIAGHNSKATQAKVIQGQIDVLKEHRNSETIFWLDGSIEKLQQQLKELEDANEN
jgi:hypothetical protein